MKSIKQVREEYVGMKSKKKENFEQVLRKVQALDKERKSTRDMLEERILKKHFKDMPVLLESQDWNLPAAEVIIDFGRLPFIFNSEEIDEKNKILPFAVWWGRIYPKNRLFILEFWRIFPDPSGLAKWATAKTFEMYLSPGNIRNLIGILQKGLEYLEKYK
jgi:hypothetical protein